MKQTKHAFTLIELIFVIVILGVLSAVAIPKLKQVKNASEHQAKQVVVDAKVEVKREAKRVELINQAHIDKLKAEKQVDAEKRRQKIIDAEEARQTVARLVHEAEEASKNSTGIMVYEYDNSTRGSGY